MKRFHITILILATLLALMSTPTHAEPQAPGSQLPSFQDPPPSPYVEESKPLQYLSSRADPDWDLWCDQDVKECIRHEIGSEFTYTAPEDHLITLVVLYSYTNGVYYIFPMADGGKRCWSNEDGPCVYGELSAVGYGLSSVTVWSKPSDPGAGESLRSPKVDVIQLLLASVPPEPVPPVPSVVVCLPIVRR